MTRLNWNRPVHRLSKEKHKPYLSIDKKPKRSKVQKPTPLIINNMLNFGKYKNFHLKDVPNNYLEWLISVTDNLDQAYVYARELARRPSYLKANKL